MSILNTLTERANNQCELCGSSENLSVYEVPPAEANSDKCILVCSTCSNQLEAPESMDVNHWRCLNDSMWSQVPAVQVVSWRMLKKLASMGETWAQDQLDMMYMEDEVRQWAEMTLADDSREPTLDSNGTPLQAGDNVVLIKDLEVKGGGFTAKRGTAVRGISLSDNPLHIEGRVNGQRIVIIAAYVKKS
jgi:protein PhnA